MRQRIRMQLATPSRRTWLSDMQLRIGVGLFCLLFVLLGENALLCCQACQPPDPPSPDNTLTFRSPSEEWKELFDGQTLAGWVQRGGKAKFQVDEEAIVGTTVRGEATSYLCTEADYGDFELQLEFRVGDVRLNSGVQVRSQSLPEYRNGMVHGYQVEIDPSERAWTGAIYDEGRRGWLCKLDSSTRQSLRLNEWHTLHVVCKGDAIQTRVNGQLMADIRDPITSQGFIALQLHSTPEVQEMKMSWRNIRIRSTLRDR